MVLFLFCKKKKKKQNGYCFFQKEKKNKMDIAFWKNLRKRVLQKQYKNFKKQKQFKPFLKKHTKNN